MVTDEGGQQHGAVTAPSFRFVQTSDSVRIAYCTQGEGPPLVFVRGWVGHIELMWESREFRNFFEPLARAFKVVRFDSRGNGLSDRKPEEISLDTLVEDLTAVVDAVSPEPVTLVGANFGTPIAIAYAAQRPERVSKLVLSQAYTRGEELLAPRLREGFIRMIREAPEAIGLVLARRTQPEADAKAYARADRIWQSVSPASAARLYEVGFTLDVTGFAREVRCPTLVLQRRGSESVRFQTGRAAAALIPNAEFTPLDGKAENPWEADHGPVHAAIGRFLGVDLLPKAEAPDSPAPVTILFTDIEDSTILTQRLGDDAAQQLVRVHNTVVREQLSRFGGQAVKHTGDGIMASFRATSLALDCAIAIQREFASLRQGEALPVHVRIGLNSGEPVAEDGDLFGTAVQLARRVCDQAPPDGILCAPAVREIVAGRGFQFADAGVVDLKGFADPVRLYSVAWR